MTTLTEEDVLFALKRCRRLAKQDLLTSSSTDDPEFWRLRAETRRAVYKTLGDIVKDSGVSMAHRRAWQRYRSLLAALRPGRASAPGVQGEEDALETFLLMLGTRPDKIAALRRRRQHREDLRSQPVRAIPSGPGA